MLRPRDRNGLEQLKRSQLHPAAAGSAAGPSRPQPPQAGTRQTVEQEVADWKQQAIAQLPQLPKGINYTDNHGNDTRPKYLDAVGRAVVTAAATKASHLEIRDMSATSVPPSVWNLKGLKELDLDLNQTLTELPEKIANLQQLTKLSAMGSSLQSLPTSIGGLPKLATLHLSGGSYETLPLGFARLGNSLQDLEISHSRPGPRGGGLKELPHMGAFKRLQNLKISGHRELAEIPASLGDLTQLRTLDLSYCPKLTSIPDLSKLQNLETLNLHGCTGLSARPEWLNQLPRGCKVILPTHLTSRRRSPETARRTEAGSSRAAEEAAYRQQRVGGWKEQLQGFKGETGANRFNLWMAAVADMKTKGHDAVMDKIDSMVRAAATSPSFRAKLFKFAADNVDVPRNLLGRQQTDLATMKSTDVNDAYNLLAKHQVPDPKTDPRQAYAILSHMMKGPLFQEITKLALDKTGSRQAAVPPLLKAYVETHDQEGKVIMEARRKLEGRQGGGPDDAAAHALTLQANDALLRHRCMEVAKKLVGW